MKKIVYGLLVLIIVILFCFIFGEIISRFLVLSSDSLPIDFESCAFRNYKMKPLSKGISIRGIRYQINSHGLRDFEYSYDKDKDVFRILILGSSLTFGYGVNLEDTFAKQLEKILNLNRDKNQLRFQVINSGVTGYNTIQQLDYLKKEGYKFSPDLVLVFFVSNNVALEPTYATVEDGVLLEKHSIKMPLIIKKIIRNSAFYHFIAYAYRQFRYKNAKNNISMKDEYKLQEELDKYQIFLKELIAFCKNKQIELVYTFFPKPEEISNGSSIKENVIKFLNKNKILIHDITPVFKKNNHHELFLKKDPCHPTKEGHSIIAKEIFKFLKTNQIVCVKNVNSN